MISHPFWIQKLTDQITPYMSPLGVSAPVGCHTFHDEENDVWEISLFTSQTEVLGGEFDGTSFHSNFVLDINSVIQVFDKVEHLEWQAIPIDKQDGLGSHISIEGIYNNNSVWLRILSKPPKECGVGQILDDQSKKLFDLW